MDNRIEKLPPLSTKLFKISETNLRTHPDTNQILSNVATFCSDIMASEELYHGVETMSVYIFPEGPQDRVTISATLMNLLFYIDDFFGEDTFKEDRIKPDLQTLLKYWSIPLYSGFTFEEFSKEDINNPHIALFKAIADTSGHIFNMSNPQLFNKLSNHLLAHIDHTLNPRPIDTLDDYIATREHFGGMYPTIDMMEFNRECYIDENDLNSYPELSDLIALCAQIGVLSNDIFSRPKERDSNYNMIAVVMRLHNMNEIEAVHFCIKYVNNLYDTYVQKVNLLKSEGKSIPQNIETYLSGLDDLVAASYWWQIHTDRYKHPDHFFPEMITNER